MSGQGRPRMLIHSPRGNVAAREPARTDAAGVREPFAARIGVDLRHDAARHGQASSIDGLVVSHAIAARSVEVAIQFGRLSLAERVHLLVHEDSVSPTRVMRTERSAGGLQLLMRAPRARRAGRWDRRSAGRRRSQRSFRALADAVLR